MYRNIFSLFACILVIFGTIACRNDNAFIDKDGDHYGSEIDCNDSDPDIHPGATDICDGRDNNCDGIIDNGFDLQNDVNNCGECGNICTGEYDGTATCNNGVCGILCNDGYADCDGDLSNGCEYDLDTNPSCTSYTALGTVSGDSDNDTTTRNDKGEKWFRVYIAETNNNGGSAIYLSATILLYPPANTDYDLYVYCDNCTTLAASSTNTGNTTEQVNVAWDEASIMGIPTGSDSGRYIYINVKYYSANTCNNYTLTIFGNIPVSGRTCSTL